MDKRIVSIKLNTTTEPKLIKVAPIPKKGLAVEKNVRFKNLRLYLAEYCDATTIHGMKYIGERGRHLLERLAWTITLAFLFTFCLLLIRQAYIKWESSPVIVTFATKETSISKIPFPAVTLCPEAKFDPEIFNFTRTFKRKQRGEMLTMLPNFDPLGITSIKWLGDEIDLGKDLMLSYTPDGVCYTFNMMPYEEMVRYNDSSNATLDSGNKTNKWSLQDGYPSDDSTTDIYPRRSFIPGFDGGLVIRSIFTNNSHIDYLCEESLRGFKVALHHPCEFPNMDKHFRLPLDQAVLVAIKPSMITVSSELLNYSPSVRKCYFPHEKYLANYKLYTQQNCLDECFANYTFHHCDCIPFYFSVLNESLSVCGPGSNECVKKSKLKYMKIEGNSESDNQQCGCLPSCTSLSYEVETSQSEWRWEKSFEALDPPQLSHLNPKEMHFSKLKIYYKELQFLSCERNERYGMIDFFSNMGGLLGLFIGFSVTSAIEILYFCTLRIICNIKKYGKKSWSGKPNVVK
ncbi:hypothetical protein RI129_010215 [Pyrocoelia pectoralis]|uniref:Uncharacterized protein n=1 Tax=Pyrocoelia pectoralis TaxID=417401 RepID=A0AAN7V7K0_9COLE